MWKWLHQIGFYSNVDSNEINIVFCCIVSLTSLFFTHKPHQSFSCFVLRSKETKETFVIILFHRILQIDNTWNLKGKICKHKII